MSVTKQQLLLSLLGSLPDERQIDQFARDCWLAGIQLSDIAQGKPPANVTEVSKRARFMHAQCSPRTKFRKFCDGMKETDPK